MSKAKTTLQKQKEGKSTSPNANSKLGLKPLSSCLKQNQKKRGERIEKSVKPRRGLVEPRRGLMGYDGPSSVFPLTCLFCHCCSWEANLEPLGPMFQCLLTSRCQCSSVY